MKKIILLLFVVVSVYSVKAQSFKFGNINTQELIALMPESDSASKKLEVFSKELTDQLEELQVEFNRKYQDYLGKRTTLTDAIKAQKEKELEDMQAKTQEFQTAAQQDFQKMQVDLTKPIVEKANAAIEKVAKTENFTYVFDISQGGSVVFFNETTTINILSLVKKELGLN